MSRLLGPVRAGTVAAAGLVLGLALAVLAPLVATAAVAEPPRPEPGRPWFGPALLYPGDTPAAYVDRLGVQPSQYTLPVPYPLDSGAVSQVRQFAALVAEQGAVLLLDVQPATRLAALTSGDAAELAGLLGEVNADLGLHVLVRFAPEMNGSWETWGQQPGAYVRAFRALAEEVRAVDSRAEWAAMVWAPVYGSGYPFREPGRTEGALDDVISRERGRWDTNGNGRLDAGDDPYLPYYPGDDWVDWVGLSMYRLGQSQGVRRNAAPPPTEFRRRLQESWGYGDQGGGKPFYERFAEARDLPMLVETAAFYNPGYRGPAELAVKRAWWSQVFAAVADYPRIAGISWLEVARAEPEARQDEPVDWRVSHEPRIARAFREALEAAPLTLGPVTPPRAPTPAPDSQGEDESQEDRDRSTTAPRPSIPVTEDGQEPWWVVGAAGLLLLAALSSLLLPGWRHRPGADRDERLDLLRGGLLIGTVVSAVAVLGAGAPAALPAALVTVGVGLLLLVSGTAHGVGHRTLFDRSGAWVAVVTRWRRARTVYVAAVGAAVLALLLDALPGVRTSLGSYGDADRLLDYPPPWFAVADLLTLRAAPWLVAVLGLFVALAVAAPLFLWLLRRGWWWAVLALSWGLYALGTATGAEVLPLASEASLPVLVWQLPFVHGLALGHHRDRVAGAATSRWVLAPVCAVVAGGAAALVLVDPSTDVPMPALVAAVGVAALAALTAWWRPLSLLLGWLLLPVGRVPLVAVVLTVPAVVVTHELVPGTTAGAWSAAAGAGACVWVVAALLDRVRSSRA